MRLNTVQSVIAVGLTLNLGLGSGVLSAAAPVIGTVAAPGSFRLDSATVSGNATLMEGALLETTSTGSTVHLTSGARVLLAAASKSRVYGDHMVIERGQGDLQNGAGYRMEANGLTIQPETGTSIGRVAVWRGNRVQVAAVNGSFRVLNARGVLVANIATGATLEFEPQSSPSAARVTGCLSNKSGRLLVTDETTNVTVEAAGPGLAKEIGNRVEINGALDPAVTPSSDASQFIRVTSVARVGKGCLSRPGAAAAAGVGTAAGAGVGTGAGVGAATSTIAGVSATTVAIVGGVAAAATLGGLAAAERLPGQGDSPSVSR